MKTFEEIRLKFRLAVLTTLCDIHGLQYNNDLSLDNLEDQLINLEPAILFCCDQEIQQLTSLIPIVEHVIKEPKNNATKIRRINNDAMLCTILLMLYSGYVLAEQSDDFIPDMLIVLQRVLGDKKGKEAFSHIIYIASSECENCSKLRQFFLFGTKIYN